jgi:hypothetical protein
VANRGGGIGIRSEVQISLWIQGDAFGLAADSASNGLKVGSEVDDRPNRKLVSILSQRRR